MVRLSSKPRNPGKRKNPADEEQEPLSDFRRASDSEEEDEPLQDPALFEEINQERIPKLESKGRKWIAQDDLAKREKTKADELADEVILIMRGQNPPLNEYSYNDLHLTITSGKAKLKGEIG